MNELEKTGLNHLFVNGVTFTDIEPLQLQESSVSIIVV